MALVLLAFGGKTYFWDSFHLRSPNCEVVLLIGMTSFLNLILKWRVFFAACGKTPYYSNLPFPPLCNSRYLSTEFSLSIPQISVLLPFPFRQRAFQPHLLSRIQYHLNTGVLNIALSTLDSSVFTQDCILACFPGSTFLSTEIQEYKTQLLIFSVFLPIFSLCLHSGPYLNLATFST